MSHALKIVLAILFAFASVPGQWFCCCAPIKLISSPLAYPEVDSDTCDCCDCKKSIRDEPQQPCPCKMLPLPEMLAMDAKATGISIVAIEPQPTIYVLQFEGMAILAIVAGSAAMDTPFLPPKARQRVHHVMHC